MFPLAPLAACVLGFVSDPGSDSRADRAVAPSESTHALDTAVRAAASDGRVCLMVELTGEPEPLSDWRMERWFGPQPQVPGAAAPRWEGWQSAGPERAWALLSWSAGADLQWAAENLAAQADVSFVSAIERAASGELRWSSPRLLVRAKSERLAWQPNSAEQAWAAEQTPRPWDSSGLADVWLWNTGLHTSYAVERLQEELKQDPDVQWSEVDAFFTGRSSAAPPNDPLFGQQWHHDANALFTGSDIDVDSVEAWDLTLGAGAGGILVIDSGVEFAHPDLDVAAGVDLTGFVAGGGQPSNTFCEYHGTWIAGLACATQGNGQGVSGVAPAAPCFSARALIADPVACDGSWTTQVSWTVEALAWGASQGASVSVNANEYGFEAQAIADQYAQLRAQGMAHVAAAGNTGFAGVGYPARLPSVMAVAACDEFGQRAAFSSSGPEVFCAAPGVEVWTTDPIGFGGFPFLDYVGINGTSAAAPIVAGGIALMQSLDSTLGVDDLEAALRLSAVDLDVPGFDAGTGWGLPKFRDAVDAVSGARPRLRGSSNFIDLGVSTGVTSGDAVDLELFAGTSHAGDTYVIAASASGTSPGLPVEGMLLPLNLDSLFLYTLGNVNPAPWTGLLGQLSPAGRAIGGVGAPPLTGELLGATVHHAVLLLDLTPFPSLSALPSKAEPLTLVGLTHQIVISQGPPQAIPVGAPGTLTTTAQVDGPNLSVHRLELELHLQHPSLGDLTVDLESPGGTIIRVHSQQGQESNELNVSYPVSAAPDESFTGFEGIDADGTWKLIVTNTGAESGTLVSWGLRLALK